MDHLKEGIGLRGYGQKNPLHEYQKEGFLLFQKMLRSMKEDIVRKLYAVRLLTDEEAKALEEAELKRREEQERSMSLLHAASPTEEPQKNESEQTVKDPERERERLKEARKQRRKQKR